MVFINTNYDASNRIISNSFLIDFLNILRIPGGYFDSVVAVYDMTGFDRMCLHSNSYLKQINSKYQNTTLPTFALLPHKPPATHRRFALPQHSALTSLIPDV